MNFLKNNVLNLSNGTLFLLSLSISSFPIVASIVSVLFIIFNLLYAYFYKDEIEKKSLLRYFPIYITFIILLISFTYSPDYEKGLNIILKSQVLLIFPFVFWARGGLDRLTLNKTKKYYVYGVGLSILMSLTLAIFNYIESGNPSNFTYYELAETIELHPTYFSLFILSAMCFIFSGAIKNSFFNVLFIFISIFSIILLESRIAFLGLFMVVIYGLMVTELKYKKFIITGAFILAIIGIFTSEGLRNRLLEVSSLEFTEQEIGTFQENGINQRAWLWSNAIEQIKQNPLFGYGLGSQKTKYRWQVEKNLLSQDFDYEFQKAAISVSKRNLHNQYLQFWYESGLIGLFLFILAIILLTQKFFKLKQYSKVLIVLLFAIFLITENLLHRQMGIFFYAFMFSLFLCEKMESSK